MLKNFKRLFKLVISLTTLILLSTSIFYLITLIADGRAIFLPVLGLWFLLAYFALPRIHRVLTRIYLPDYFIGRTRSSDGFYADPINLAFHGTAQQLHAAMRRSNWTLADELSVETTLKLYSASLRNKSYASAPVSPAYLFSRKQDFAYQQEPKNHPRTRHHIRFWKTPRNWWLPGGHTADWLASATFDKHVGLSLYTGQITHKVSEHTDQERNYVIKSLQASNSIRKLEIIKHFTTAFRHRNGGGDKINTDGSLPFITLT